MKTHLTQVGNSKSVILPPEILAASGIGDEIELVAEAGRILILPAKFKRQGWFDSYQEEVDEDAFAPLSSTDADCEEWEW